MYHTFSSCLKNHHERCSSASVRVSKIYCKCNFPSCDIWKSLKIYCNFPSCDIWKSLKIIVLAIYVSKVDLLFSLDICLKLQN